MKEYNYDILSLIEELENISSDNKEILRKAKDQYEMGNKASLIKLLIDIFKNKNRSAKEKINIILEYNSDYDTVEKLLDKLEISFIEFNSIIGNNANEKLIDQVNSRLDDILSKMTESVQQEENSRSEEPILRNSQLNIEAEEFADNLYKKLYKNK